MTMDELLEGKLIECLDALEAGESVEQALAHYPEDAGELQPLLALAGALPELRQRPPEIAQARSRRAFLAQAGAVLPAQARRPQPRGLARIMSMAAAAAVLVAAVGAGLLALSSPALPGDTLYPAKRSFETVRLLLAPSGERQNVERELKQVRTREIEALLAGGREARVALEGELQAIQPGEWLVAGIPVRVDASTVIEGSPQPGQDVRVEGVTHTGAIQATLIRAIGGPAPQPTVTAPPTLGATSPRATSTPAVTPTATLAPATSTPDVPPTATLAPATPVPAPTATPDDDHDDDDGSDQDDDDDDDDGSDHDDDDDDDSGSGKDDDDDDPDD